MTGCSGEKIFETFQRRECHAASTSGWRQPGGLSCERWRLRSPKARVEPATAWDFIKLAAPVFPCRYLKGIPSYVAILLDMPLRMRKWADRLLSILLCGAVIKGDQNKDLTYKQLLNRRMNGGDRGSDLREDSEIARMSRVVGTAPESLQKPCLRSQSSAEIAEQLRETSPAAKAKNAQV